MVQGESITGFADTEKAEIELTSVVSYLAGESLKKRRQLFEGR